MGIFFHFKINTYIHFFKNPHKGNDKGYLDPTHHISLGFRAYSKACCFDVHAVEEALGSAVFLFSQGHQAELQLLAAHEMSCSSTA
jgi:hypothetical protein